MSKRRFQSNLSLKILYTISAIANLIAAVWFGCSIYENKPYGVTMDQLMKMLMLFTAIAAGNVSTILLVIECRDDSGSKR